MIELISDKNKENLMKLPVKQTTALAACLIMIFGGNVAAQTGSEKPRQLASTTQEASQTVNKVDINVAQLSENHTGSATVIMPASQPEIIVTPVQTEIVATDNPVLLPGSVTAVIATLSAAPAVSASAAILTPPVVPASPSAPVNTVATTPGFIDTQFPDPMSPDFPSAAVSENGNRQQSAAEIIDEITRRADEIARKTALQTDDPSDEPDQPPVDSSPAVETVVEPTPATTPDPDGATEPAAPVTSAPETPVITRPAEPVTASGAAAAEPPTESPPEEKLPDGTTVELPVDDSIINEMPLDEEPAGVATLTWPDSDIDPELSALASQSLLVASGSEPADSLFEKTPSLEPALMVKGAPVDEQCDLNQTVKLSGQIVPEKQPLGRRRHLFRWVIKTEDGRRIPLKSNLKLLQEVRRENLIDGQVSLTGRFVSSGYNDDLRYFIVESAAAATGNASAAAALDGGSLQKPEPQAE